MCATLAQSPPAVSSFLSLSLTPTPPPPAVFQRRCAEYLPPSEALDHHRLYGDFQVTLMAKAKRDKFVVSTVQLKVRR